MHAPYFEHLKGFPLSSNSLLDIEAATPRVHARDQVSEKNEPPDKEQSHKRNDEIKAAFPEPVSKGKPSFALRHGWMREGCLLKRWKHLHKFDLDSFVTLA